jgi:hypothetical protein
MIGGRGEDSILALQERRIKFSHRNDDIQLILHKTQLKQIYALILAVEEHMLETLVDMCL